MNFSKFKSRAMDAAKKCCRKKSSSEYVGKRDAGAIATKKMRDKEQQKYVGFLPANESVSEAKQELIFQMLQKQGMKEDLVQEPTGWSRNIIKSENLQ